jgi:hypothetical protein
MAATVQMTNSETGETRWFYTVDAKEFLSQEGNKWAMTGEVKRSGWATLSAPGQRGGSSAPAKTQSEQIAEGIATGISKALAAVSPQATTLRDVLPAGDAVSAGLPPEDDFDEPAAPDGEASPDMLD